MPRIAPSAARRLGLLLLPLLLVSAAAVVWKPWRRATDPGPAASPGPPPRSFRAIAPSPPGPIVLAVIDTLRADHLDAYGYTLPTSAGLRAVLDRSTRFTNCRAAATWTSPSTATILTGLTPYEHGVLRFGDGLPEGCQTMAEILADAGWETRGISFNLNVARKTRFDQGYGTFVQATGRVIDYPDVGEMAAHVQAWCAEGLEPRTFLYLHPMNCHGPYKVPAEFKDRLLGRQPSSEFVYASGAMRQLMKEKDLASRSAIPASYVASMTEQYDTAIRYCLDRLGGIFLDLDAQGLLDPALVIITADHGEELFDHGGFGHGYTLYEECLHVPLFVKLPGQRAPALVEDRVALLDLLPTVVAHAGLAADPDLPGEDLRPLLDDGPAAEALRDRLLRRSLVAVTVGWPERMQGEAIYSGDFKLISIRSSYQHAAPTKLLFDLSADPLERRDLAGAEPALVHFLGSALAGAARAGNARPFLAVNVRDSFDPEQVRALGY